MKNHKFKVGDIIQDLEDGEIVYIIEVEDFFYRFYVIKENLGFSKGIDWEHIDIMEEEYIKLY